MSFSNKAKNSLLLCLTVALFACAKGVVDPIDQQTGLTKNEYNKSIIKDFQKTKKEKSEQASSAEAPIPNTSRLIVVAPPPSNVTSKTISFSVTDQVPLKDVLIELGRVAKIDIDLDPNISGGIVLNARNRPLGEVIERIANLGKLRYNYDKGILRFERDTPYTINYSVDYLSEGSNLWADVQANISAILSNSANTSSSANPPASTVAADGTTTTIVAATAFAKSALTINKTAGILAVFATRNEHAEITKYLANVEENASAQVLIEAKVVEVTLNDAFKAGINWGSLGKQNNLTATNGFVAASPISFVTSELFNSSITASISALEQFGTTRTLSSPRIHAINNQKAILNFTNKLVYFRIDNTQQSLASTGSTTSALATTLTSTKQEENVGVELNIVPSINLKTSEVTLNIKPKITIKTGDVIDPASPKDKDGKVTFENKVPVIQARELSTTAKVQSGNVIVIGGLMSDSSTSKDVGVPFLQRIPVLGFLFKSVDKTSDIVETVIFIKATIVNSGSAANKVDRELQEKFDTNRRKFF